MTNEAKKYYYPVARHKRGITAIVTAVAGEVLFTFFLLVGFGEYLWAVAVSTIISLLMVMIFLSGVSLSRSGRGGVEITTEVLIVFRGKEQIELPWNQMEAVQFGGLFQPFIKLKAGTAGAVVYKALPGYPLLWHRLAPFQSANILSPGAVTIRANRTQHLGAIAASSLLLLVAAVILPVLGIPAGLTPLVAGIVAAFLGLGAALGVWAMLRIRRRYILDDAGITCRSWGRTSHIPISAMKEVVLEQARFRELAVGYRYRGEAMTTAVPYAPVELGLGVHLILQDGEWRLDETMTGFPMERLYEELCHRYHLTGRIAMPEMGLQ